MNCRAAAIESTRSIVPERETFGVRVVDPISRCRYWRLVDHRSVPDSKSEAVGSGGRSRGGTSRNTCSDVENCPERERSPRPRLPFAELSVRSCDVLPNEKVESGWMGRSASRRLQLPDPPTEILLY